MDQPGEAIHTVHILVPRFVEPEFDKFSTCRQELIFVDVASEGLEEKKRIVSVFFFSRNLNVLRATTYIPRVPPQSWQFSLYKFCISVEYTYRKRKRERNIRLLHPY